MERNIRELYMYKKYQRKEDERKNYIYIYTYTNTLFPLLNYVYLIF